MEYGAEEPLPAGGSCLLGALNLAAFVKNPYTPEATFDFEDFKESIKIAVVALNQVLDEGMSLHPLKEQQESVHDWRQTGLGAMGIADMLIKLNLIYGSEPANNFCAKIAEFLLSIAVTASDELGESIGAYPNYNQELVNKSKLMRSIGIETEHLANSQLLTIAPTGTISTMIGVSGGIEPIFANSYTRTTKSLHGEDKTYKIYTPIVKEYMEIFNIESEEDLPSQFITAKDISPDDRIQCQAAWQQYIDASISSTINLPNSATVEDIEKIYIKAWQKGLKGITIYRAGCDREGILIEETSNKKVEDKSKKTYGIERHLTTGCGSLHICAFFNEDGELINTYLSKGSTGGCVSCDTEYFNGKEWKPISEYTKGEQVLQYNKDGSASLTMPIEYIVNDNVPTLKHFKNTMLDMMLSDDHRMYLYTNYGKFKAGIRKELHDEIITVQEWIDNGKKERHIPTTFSYSGNGIPLTDDEIRFCVMTYADGHICNPKTKHFNISVSKSRKKDRAKKLFDAINLEHDEYIYPSQPNFINFKFHAPKHMEEWLMDKQFTSKWYDCSKHQLEIIFDEILSWDGSQGKDNRMGEYYSSKIEEIDFIQFMFAALGYRATISTNGKENSYRVRPTKLSILNIKSASITDESTIDNKSYCFTVPSGMLVLRYNKHIFITGNCNNYMIGLSRLIGLAARAGTPIAAIIDQLNSCGSCPSYAVRAATKHDTSPGSCCPVAVGKALKEMYYEVTGKMIEKKEEKISVPTCEKCGFELIQEGGCVICKNCGWSKCD